jgi:hypothetical protein
LGARISRSVDEEVGQLDVGILRPDARDDLAPELHHLEHVGLVDRAELPAPVARAAEGDMGDTLDLGLRIAHRVEGLALAARVDAVAARLAEVGVSGELP